MRFSFKKISAIATSVLMAGMTLGVAAAASYPEPFVSGSSSNVAIVYGTGTGVSALDTVQAGNIQTDLQDRLPSSGSSTSGGEYYKFEKTSTKFHLGDNITSVVSSAIDDDEMPVLLANGKFVDDDNDEFDYDQEITIGPNLQLGMFEDNDYAEDEPTVGFRIPSGTTVLNYTLDFTDEPDIADIVTTDLPFMGKTYYVLSNSSSSTHLILTLLDSAKDTVLTEGDSMTLDVEGTSYECEIAFISTDEVKLKINGELTNSLEESETYKLSDGSYIGIKDILYSSKEGTVSKVEFSIGSGKLKLTDGSEVEINDETVPGLTAYVTNDSTGVKLDKIVLKWAADEDLFITEDTEVTMPGFEIVKLSYGGLTYPVEETIEVQGSDTYAVLENFPLKDSTEDIPFLYATTAGAFVGIGKDDSNRLITANNTHGTANITFDGDTDEWFLASWSDGSDAESYLMKATKFAPDGTDNNKTDFQYRKDGAWVNAQTNVNNGDTFSIGNVELAVGAIDRVGKQVYVWNNSANTNFSTLYSKEGMTVYMPYLSTNSSTAEGAFNVSTDGTGTIGHNATSFYLFLFEEDKNGNKAHADGDYLNLTIGWDSSTTPEVEVSAVNTESTDATSKEIGDTDVWRDFTYSALATEILYNKPSSGQKSVKLVYHGDEVAADVYITSPEASVISEGAQLGDVLVKDSEVSSVSSKNLIIVGGSCINSAAANVLGGAYCGASFTDETGVGAGQFLLKGFSGAYTSGKIALVVAGYDAADTVAATTYLTTQEPDTSKAYKGTSSTSAELIVE